MESRPKQIFAIKCLTLRGGNDVKPEVHAVIGANDQPGAQTAAITIISAAMKRYFTQRERDYQSQGHKSQCLDGGKRDLQGYRVTL